VTGEKHKEMTNRAAAYFWLREPGREYGGESAAAAQETGAGGLVG